MDAAQPRPATRWLVCVDSPSYPNACWGFTVECDGRVTECAPIGRKSDGYCSWRSRDLVAYWRKRGATVTWQPHPIQ